jgi:hypothetical protein
MNNTSATRIKDTLLANAKSSQSSANTPTVSFVILCYKLAHLLPECLNSVLSQTYEDFEVLIMDDCSPDNTADVVKTFRDPRIKYVRNEKNLGVQGNQNEGVRLSCGKYVWIISADDYLRRPYVVQRYVELLEKNPHVGYTFCSGVAVRDGREMEVLNYSKYRDRDEIISGQKLLRDLLYRNFVLAPSVMVRRECYEKIGLYPHFVDLGGVNIDMIWAADWYLWCLFALSYDVAYFAEPMVGYREHDLSISSSMSLSREKLNLCVAADIAVPWMIRRKANASNLKALSKVCLHAVAHEYAAHGESKRYRNSNSWMSIGDFEDSLCRGTQNEAERDWIRAQFYAARGNRLCIKGKQVAARKFYFASLQKDPASATVYAHLLFSLGKPGLYLRKFLRAVRGLVK